ncbi:MAG: hypothetical protein AAGK66_11145 [Pseudomonadota bacterium]
MESPKTEKPIFRRQNRIRLATGRLVILIGGLCFCAVGCSHDTTKTSSDEVMPDNPIVEEGDEVASEQDESNPVIPNVRDIIASGDYNDDKLPLTPVPDIGIVDREIPNDTLKDRVEAVQARQDEVPE